MSCFFVLHNVAKHGVDKDSSLFRNSFEVERSLIHDNRRRTLCHSRSELNTFEKASSAFKRLATEPGRLALLEIVKSIPGTRLPEVVLAAGHATQALPTTAFVAMQSQHNN